MKFFLISDNNDTAVGMRLTGIEGVVVHEADEVRRALSAALDNPEIGIILITERLIALCPEEIDSIRLSRQVPLIVAVPDRHGSASGESEISKYVREAIGVRI